MTMNVSQLKPMPGYVLVEPVKSDKQTSSGIILPDSHDEKAQYGKVLSVGAEIIDEKGKKQVSPVKRGELVVYKKWGGSEFKLGDTEYQFFKFEDVLATIETKKV